MNALEHCKVRLPFFLYTLYISTSSLSIIYKDEVFYSWVLCDIINFTVVQLQIDTQWSERNNFSLCVFTLCLAANTYNLKCTIMKPKNRKFDCFVLCLNGRMEILFNTIPIFLKGNSTPKTSCVCIKYNTFNTLFPKYLGPNHFIKGEIDCQSSRFLQNPTPC